MTFRSVATAQATGYSGTQATATSITVAKPSGTVAGDILVACIDIDIASGIRAPLVANPPSGWSTVANSNSSSVAGVMHLFWKVAGASEPSSYTFEFRQNTTSGLLSPAFSNAIIGCWTDWTAATLKTFASAANRYKLTASGNVNFVDPAFVPDIASVTLDGSESTTGGIQIAFWSTWSEIENFNGTIVWPPPMNPAYPATVPWNTAALNSPQAQHTQIHYEGLPAYFGGEGVTETLATNRMLTLGSFDVSAGTLPDISGQFTWQHAGAEAGYSEIVEVFRLVIEATPVGNPYWGINAITVLPF